MRVAKQDNEADSLARARGFNEVRQVLLEGALIERSDAICELNNSGGRYVLGREEHGGDVSECLVSTDFDYCL